MKKNTILMPLTLCAALLDLTGCAQTAKYLHSQPSTHFPTKQELKLPDKIADVLKLHCTLSEDITYEDMPSPSEGVPGNSHCLYISADATKATSADLDKDTRDQVISTLVSISDMNCSTFLDRAFANRAGMDLGKRISQDAVSAVSAGTVLASPGLSAGLDVVNLFVGKTVDAIATTYYFDKTFQAMEAAIEAERSKRRAFIAARQSGNVNKYSVRDALADIRQYDDACSIRAGLSRLVSVAENEKKDSETRKLRVQATPSIEKFTAEFAK